MSEGAWATAEASEMVGRAWLVLVGVLSKAKIGSGPWVVAGWRDDLETEALVEAG